jgi:hypothetical protein
MKPMKMLPLLLPILLAGCFTHGQKQLVTQAVGLTRVAIQDPLFTEVVLELDRMQAIEWDTARTNELPEAARAEPTRWLLRQYQEHGPFEVAEVNAWIKWREPWTITTAATTPGDDETYLNIFKLGRSRFSVANTLLHERAHTFCQVHPVTQTRADNLCDAAYVFGDLAEVVTRYREEGMPAAPDQKLCPALCDVLRARGLIGQCEPVED